MGRRKRHLTIMVIVSSRFALLLVLLLVPQGPFSSSSCSPFGSCHVIPPPLVPYPQFRRYQCLQQYPNVATRIVSYTTMLGLAIQSNHWKYSMENELVLLAKSIAQATTWQDAAAADESKAQALTEKALSEKIQAESMEQEAEALKIKGQEDEMEATAMGKESEGLYVEASQEKQESMALLVEATAEQVTEKDDLAKATADATWVAKNAASVEGDEAGTILCQWIPIVDVVCDVVGGVVAVGLETQGVREASIVTEEYAAAMALQSRVDSLTQQAEEMESTSMEQGQEANVLQEKAARLDALAQEELTHGQAQEVAAEEALSQSLMDKEMGTEEETTAVTEEEESVRSWKESVQHGAKACGKALMMCIASVVALVFWMVRIGASVLGGVRMCSSSLGVGDKKWSWCWWWTRDRDRYRDRTQQRIVYHSISHMVHHGLLFILFFGFEGKEFLNLRNLTGLSAMGGVILGFSWNLATVQTLCLHSLPNVYQVHHQQRHQEQQQQQQRQEITLNTLGSYLWVAMLEYIRVMLVLLPLTIMEILLIWVNFGRWVFVPTVVQWAQKRWLWGLLWLVTTVMHYRCFVLVEEMSSLHDGYKTETDLLNRSTRKEHGVADQVVVVDYGTRGGTRTNSSSSSSSSNSNKSFSRSSSCTSRVTERNVTDLDEEVSLLYNDNEKWDENVLDEQSTGGGESIILTETDAEKIFRKGEMDSLKKKSFVALVIEDASRIHLMLLFEVLMASIMFALLNQSTRVAKDLWPASKSVLLTVYPHFHVMAGVFVAMSAFLLMCACL